MQVSINGKSVDIAQGSDLATVLSELGIRPEQCATAVNGEFVARPLRAERILSPNDQVMTFEPITGG
ncbi:MAG: sulfur carrier protein ThiS [Burkholderiaceae bacterium]|jgi:sulfur carrier protein|nr:sulfur carrier protein ThiS [Burkholderiaceae bacterium]